jgi:hypothetical protein
MRQKSAYFVGREKLRLEKYEVQICEGIASIDLKRTHVSRLEYLDKIQGRKGLKFENSRVWSSKVINIIDFTGQVFVDHQHRRIGVRKTVGFEISKLRSSELWRDHIRLSQRDRSGSWIWKTWI